MRLRDLGFAAQRVDTVKQAHEQVARVVISAAPSRHGIGSTQYAILRSHDVYMNNIHALEREKLLELDNVTQQLFEGAQQGPQLRPDVCRRFSGASRISSWSTGATITRPRSSPRARDRGP